MANNYVYKILDTETGLYKNAGSGTRVSPKGKVWKSRQALGLHLGMCLMHRHTKRTKDIIKDYLMVFPTHKIQKYELKLVEEFSNDQKTSN